MLSLYPTSTSHIIIFDVEFLISYFPDNWFKNRTKLFIHPVEIKLLWNEIEVMRWCWCYDDGDEDDMKINLVSEMWNMFITQL